MDTLYYNQRNYRCWFFIFHVETVHGKNGQKEVASPSHNLTLTMFAQFNLALMGELVHSSYNFIMSEENSINECQRKRKLRLGFVKSQKIFMCYELKMDQNILNI